MATVSRTEASLKFGGDHLDPDEITQLLGRNPTSAQRKGDVIVGKNTGQARIARTGLWILRAPSAAPGDLDAQITQILDHTTSDLSVWLQLSEAYEAYLYSSLVMTESNEGLTISPKSLFKLAERRLMLGLDVYGGSEPIKSNSAEA